MPASPSGTARGFSGGCISPSKSQTGVSKYHAALAGGYVNQPNAERSKPGHSVSMKNTPSFGSGHHPETEDNIPSVVHISADDLLSQTQNSFFASQGKGGGQARSMAQLPSGSMQRSPPSYRIPGGRYIPRKEAPHQLDSLESHHVSTQSVDNFLSGASRHIKSTSSLPFDPKDPPGRNALPSSHHGGDTAVHPLRRSQHPYTQSKKPKMVSIPQTPFKSVDQWLKEEGSSRGNLLD